MPAAHPKYNSMGLFRFYIGKAVDEKKNWG